MSPMSSLMVEISAVMVASTRWRLVMIECVASTRARISSRSTLTASMAAVKSSMSRSQASTMRRTWLTSPLLLFRRSLSSPTSNLSWSKSSAMVSMPADCPPASSGFIEEAPRLTCESFLSKSLCMLLSWAVSWASKSCSRVDTFFRIWASLLLAEPGFLPAVSAPSAPVDKAASCASRAARRSSTVAMARYGGLQAACEGSSRWTRHARA
mmetsp:Transcript_53247/g.148788  ORF Transcript_53247/g.148788 Transcript_53247/m.148788 type:complete len:211 (-) Transcript_53247:8-640(-)